MYSLAVLAFSSFILALLLTPLVRNLCRRWGIVDEPGEERRVHTAPVPRLGGVAIGAAYVGAFGILLLLEFSASGFVRNAFPVVEKLLPAVLVIFAVGLLDDLVGLKPWQKFGGQLMAAGFAIWGGIHVQGIGGLEFSHWLCFPITVLWLVGCSNAFNLIDGMDGLAAGIGLFATVTVIVSALIHGNVPLAMATAPLAGALLGFLRYNFNPATIFLGDSGSLLIGFLLGCFGVIWSQKSATALGMTAPLMALAIPLLDTGLSIVRRFLRQRNVWDADRGHIHHRLLDRGLTTRKAVLLLYALAALGAVLSVLQSALDNQQFAGIVVVLFCAAAWIGVQHLGYVEFGVVGRMFMDGAFRRHLNSQLALQGFEERLRKAVTPTERWEAIRSSAKEFGYDGVKARIGGEEFSFENGGDKRQNGWVIRIPVAEGEYVNLTRRMGTGDTVARVGPFADVVLKVLSEKTEVLSRRNQDARAVELGVAQLETEPLARSAAAD